MNDFLNCYDENLKKVAVLQNAYEIEETQELNTIYHLSFKMPGDDPKLDYIKPFYYIRWNEDGQLYRIIKRSSNMEDYEIVTVDCEHVIAILCNDLMYGSYTYGGGTVKTSDVIEYLLGMQKTKNWELGGCDFDRRFEYTWKHENIFNALFHIPMEFSDDYMWDFETTTYPWRLYLRKLDKKAIPNFYIRAERNLISSTDDRDYSTIYTRIYPLGSEENEVQVDITSVNDGLPYIQADDDVIREYGLIEAVMIDQRFDNPETLKAYAETVLRNCIEPSMTRTFNVVDLYQLTNATIDKAYIGAIARLTLDGSSFFIRKTVRILDEPGNLSVEFSSRSYTVADRIASLAQRVQIASVYS